MALSSIRTSRMFRFASWLALWVMLLPALLPLLHHPAAMAGAGRMPICHTALGDSDQKQTPDNEKSKAACPICQGLNTLAQGFVAPEVTGLVQVSFASEDVVQPYRMMVVFEPSSPSWPRAPPVLA